MCCVLRIHCRDQLLPSAFKFWNLSCSVIDCLDFIRSSAPQISWPGIRFHRIRYLPRDLCPLSFSWATIFFHVMVLLIYYVCIELQISHMKDSFLFTPSSLRIDSLILFSFRKILSILLRVYTHFVNSSLIFCFNCPSFFTNKVRHEVSALETPGSLATNYSIMFPDDRQSSGSVSS